jgi:anti-sigma regulatory factor (Ser/Thr protein kinase)
MPVQWWVTPSDAAQVEAVRRLVVAYAAEHGVSGAVLGELTIAVSELVTNVLVPDGRRPSASISVDVRDDRITVVVRGARAGLSPLFDGAAAHRGMVIVAAVAHDLRVDRTADGGCEVSMTLRRDAAATAET